MGMVSPPWEEPAARHAEMSTVFVMYRTLPSHMPALMPLVCRLRANTIRGRVVVEVVVHGIGGLV